MDSQMKHRIVGVVVLVLLMVVLVPLLFNGTDKSMKKPSSSQEMPPIPTQPPVKNTHLATMPEVKQLKKIKSAPVAKKINAFQHITQTLQATSRAVAKQQQTVIKKVRPTAKFVSTKPHVLVQVGSFSSKDNAVNMVQKLRKHGYHTRLITARHWKKRVYRVVVKSENGRKRAEELISELYLKFNIKGIIIKE